MSNDEWEGTVDGIEGLVNERDVLSERISRRLRVAHADVSLADVDPRTRLVRRARLLGLSGPIELPDGRRVSADAKGLTVSTARRGTEWYLSIDPRTGNISGSSASGSSSMAASGGPVAVTVELMRRVDEVIVGILVDA